MGDRFTVKDASGSFAMVTNAGTGELNIGADAQVGNLVATGPVMLRSRAAVNGDVMTSSTITPQDGVTVTGTQLQYQTALAPAQPTTWPVPARGSSGGNVQLEPGQQRTLAPGTWGAVSVKTNAKLTLSTGTYWFDALDVLEPSAKLYVNTMSGPVLVYVSGSFTSRGIIVDTAGNGSNLLFVVLSQNWIALESPFRGTLLAPYGYVRLSATLGDSHRGSFFSKEVYTNADARVTLVPFSGWNAVGACAPLTPEERTKAQSLGLAPDAIYAVKEMERHIHLPVAASSKIRLGLRYESGRSPRNTAGRFRVLSMNGTQVLGGATYVLRH